MWSIFFGGENLVLWFITVFYKHYRYLTLKNNVCFKKKTIVNFDIGKTLMEIESVWNWEQRLYEESMSSDKGNTSLTRLTIE